MTMYSPPPFELSSAGKKDWHLNQTTVHYQSYSRLKKYEVQPITCKNISKLNPSGHWKPRQFIICLLLVNKLCLGHQCKSLIKQ